MTAALTQAADGEVTGVTVSGSTYSATVAAKQTQTGWQNTSIEDIGGLPVGDSTGQVNAKTSGSSWTVSYNDSTGVCTIN